MAKILAPTAANIAAAAEKLRSGDVVGMPTETVYGLAAFALDDRALARVFAVKERPTFDPLIVHVSRSIVPEHADALEALADRGLIDLGALSATARERASRLLKAFWPGPLTLVLPKHARVPDLATSGLASVGLRMPAHPVALALIDAAGGPLAAPSANRFGRISPTTAQAVADELGDRIELILDGGACAVGVESTVAALTADGALTSLRPGAISTAQLEAVAGVAASVAPTPTAKHAAQTAPGLLESHYAPRARVVLLPRAVAELSPKDVESGYRGPCALLVLHGQAQAKSKQFCALTGLDVETLALSATGDVAEIARGLFQALRKLDAAHPMVIFCEPPPAGETGLAYAIADRLRRAAAPRN